MKKKVWVLTSMASVLSFSLISCSTHQNPILLMPKDVASQFLLDVSEQAEKSLNLYQPPGGYYYSDCMDGKEQASLCSKLYQSMLHYAQLKPNVKHITLPDLTSKTMWKSISETYKRKQFEQV